MTREEARLEYEAAHQAAIEDCATNGYCSRETVEEIFMTATHYMMAAGVDASTAVNAILDAVSKALSTRKAPN